MYIFLLGGGALNVLIYYLIKLRNDLFFEISQ